MRWNALIFEFISTFYHRTQR